jgi:ArsR family transcriptional regulator, arsenate/arsenite/antimonite-responsive transcriptional repressor / arsenate reductase (thioredoxin)
MLIYSLAGVSDSFEERVAVYSALGDPSRLAMVDDLRVSDRSPTELAVRHRLSSNLLAHHLVVLESAGLISRGVSAGDARRRYVRLDHARLNAVAVLPALAVTLQPEMVFLCTHNSARSQLAAALWIHRTGGRARSAGTHPAPQIHQMAREAGVRRGLDLATATPQLLDASQTQPQDAQTSVQVVTVCDRVHEDLNTEPGWWHWSIPDPVETGTEAAFDAVISELDLRIDALLHR